MQKVAQTRRLDVDWPQALIFCTIPHSTIVIVLNCCTKRKGLQNEELLVEHANHKFQMHG
jgi:hypothetical protein